MTPQEGVGDRIGRPGHRSGSRDVRAGVPATRRPVMLVLAGLFALASTGCDKGLAEGDLVVDNRTDSELTVYLKGDPEADSEPGSYGTIRPGTSLTVAGMDGCSVNGFDVRDPEGNVVAELPPLDRDEHDCKFTWVVTEDDSFIEQ